MLVPTPDCEANKGTGTEAKKELVCDGDDVLEPPLKGTARQLRRKLSSCTEKLEEGTGTGKLEEGTSKTSSSSRFSKLNTTVSRTARFSTEKLEEGTGTGKVEDGTSNTSSSSRFSNLNITVPRNARFSTGKLEEGT